MVSMYDVLKASKGLPIDDIFAELWGRKLSGDYTIVTYRGTLPVTLTGTKAGYLHRYKIYGNTVQASTPTPSTPVAVEGVGEETDSLFDIDTVVLGKYIDANGVEQTSTGSAINKLNHTDYINILPNTDYTFTYSSTAIPTINTVALCWYDSEKQLISRTTKNVSGKNYYINGTSPSTAAYCIINFIGYYETSVYKFNESGTTPLYYKIPVNVQSGNLWNEVFPEPSENMNKYIPIYVGDGDFTFSTNGGLFNSQYALYMFMAGRVTSGGSTANNGVSVGHPRTVTAINGYVTIVYHGYSGGYYPENFWGMLNRGSTPLPYQPYSNTTTNIYLYSVTSTRRIKKLVLDGTENWELQSINSYGVANYRMPLTGRYSDVDLIMSTHYAKQTTPLANTRTAGIYNYGNPYFYIRDTNTDDVVSFKTFLAGQYANGTPVCVYYVLREPETAATNEPLMKIGSYADTIDSTQTTAQIPTTTGSTTISWAGEGTAPSEVEFEYERRR